MRLNRLIISFLFSAVLIPCVSWSATVKKVKGSSVLINTDSSNIKAGALYYLVRNGKKKAIIKVVKVKPGQAIGKVLKGKAQPGLTLVRRPSKKKKRSSVAKKNSSLPPLKTASSSKKSKSKSSSYKSGGSFKDKLSIGGMVNLGQDTAKVTSSTGSSNGSGSSTSFELIADYNYSEKIKIRASLGQQSFVTEDKGVTIGTGPGAPTSRIDLGYINADIIGKYHFTPMFWAGGGVGLLLSPSYGGTTAVQEDDLGSQIYVQLGGGVDYKINDKFYIPAMLEYGTTLASGDATLSSIGIKFGLAMKL